MNGAIRIAIAVAGTVGVGYFPAKYAVNKFGNYNPPHYHFPNYNDNPLLNGTFASGTLGGSAAYNLLHDPALSGTGLFTGTSLLSGTGFLSGTRHHINWQDLLPPTTSGTGESPLPTTGTNGANGADITGIGGQGSMPWDSTLAPFQSGSASIDPYLTPSGTAAENSSGTDSDSKRAGREFDKPRGE
ncbi:MAG TPA: hypothetical protein VG733_05985 [Chthoniobacteraceae bacterium]|nr:hypothetical protein [Chthoniobacteraceae bacterium]